MIRYFQNRFTLSDKGAKDLRRGIVFSTLLNLALMLPPTYLFLFLMEYLEVGTDQHTLWFYILLAVVLMGMMFFIARWQYDSTYTTIYNESASTTGDWLSPSFGWCRWLWQLCSWQDICWTKHLYTYIM